MTYRILISNDDGIDAPGLLALYDAVSSISEVTVVAPATERSAIGHAISVYSDLTLLERMREGRIWGYGLEGTPADCVKFAITRLMKDPPHLVLSGINRGENIGNSILYSGTVAAAIEGTMYGFPSIAISLAALPPKIPCYDYAARFSSRLARFVLKKGLPQGVLLNVNIPNVPEKEIRGVVVSRQGKSMFEDIFEHQGEKNGLPAFRNIGNKMVYSAEGEDFDDFVLRQNKISITPLQYDLTHHELRLKIDRWLRQEVESELFEIKKPKPRQNK
jgi:5'-nucleotidase